MLKYSKKTYWLKAEDGYNESETTNDSISKNGSPGIEFTDKSNCLRSKQYACSFKTMQ